MDQTKVAEWLLARLTSDAARDDWRDVLAAGVSGWLDRPVAEVLPELVFMRALDDVLTAERLAEIARGAMRLVLAEVTVELEGDDQPVGRYLDDDAKVRLDALVGREGLVDESWVDVVFGQKAMEELFEETLFRALEDFSEAIPNLMQSATPAALGKIASRLQGATGGVRDRMREELKARIEPEIRRFVHKATRRLLDGTASFVKAGMDREGAVLARRNLLRHALDRPTSTYLRHLDAEAREELEAVLLGMIATDGARAEARTRLLSMHQRVLARFGDRSVRSVLAAHDVEPDLDFEAWADATWPSVRAFAQSGLPTFLDKLAAELVAEMANSTPN